MKIIASIGLALTTALASQAAMLEFELSPEGTDAGVGLSPLNTVPPATNSMGSGGALGDGIIYDTESGLLMINIGYGAAAGFTNLTGPVTLTHIHGPATNGEVADVVADLKDIHFVSFNGATNGGIIQGGIMIETNKAQDLLDNLWYVNLHTATNPAGELRGQLILANVAPVIICSADSTNECGDLSSAEIHVSDADGDDVTVFWSVNGMEMSPVMIPGEAALAGTNITIEAEYPAGTNVLEFMAVDALEFSSECSTTIIVEDTIPPVIVATSATPNRLWPPNHKMVTVTVSAQIEEACGEVSWGITGVTSNEPINDTGDGNTDPDWEIIDADTVELRAERAGNLSGRVYTIWVEAIDDSGNMSDAAGVEVVVPHDQGKAKKKSKRMWWWSR